MKRLIGLFICACVVVGGTSVRAQTVEVHDHGLQTAIAIWTEKLPRGRGFDVFWAIAGTGVIDGERVTKGTVGHSTCPMADWDLVQFLCMRTGLRHLNEDEFTIDPALGEAHLRIERKGKISEVTWIASEDPIVFQDGSNEGAYLDAGVIVSRRADVDAEILGHRFKPNGARLLADLSLRSGVGIWAEAERRGGV